MLIGGNGNDQVSGLGGRDLLIGGDGGAVLTTSTVQSDNVADTLTGGADLDWVWLGPVTLCLHWG
jgi:hypothetical protein